MFMVTAVFIDACSAGLEHSFYFVLLKLCNNLGCWIACNCAGCCNNYLILDNLCKDFTVFFMLLNSGVLLWQRATRRPSGELFVLHLVILTETQKCVFWTSILRLIVFN